ncbi:protein NLRC5 [Pogona vitticeps]
MRTIGRMLRVDRAGRQRAIRSSWPQLVDFLSQHPEWVLRKAKQLLSRMELMRAEGVTDPKEKALLVLNMFLEAADTTFETFIQSVCMEFSLPMELEIMFMSVSREAEDHVARVEENCEAVAAEFPSTSTTHERRRPWSGPSSMRNGKESKQQCLDSAERYRQLIITSMRQRYAVYRSGGDTQGKDQPLAFGQAFVSLVIRQSRAWRIKKRKDRAKEEHDVEEAHSDAPLRLSDLFETVPTGATKVVFLLGRPGVGKTRLVHKICEQWAERNLTQFHMVFPFEFRQLNLIERKLSLQELLFDFFLRPDVSPDAVFEHLLENAQQILMIFDGLDEFVENVHLSLSSHVLPSGHRSPFSVAELLAGLCQGKLLPGCTVLVTTRPKIIPQMLLKTITQQAEIWGFDLEKVEEYAECFFRHHSRRDQALACLKSNGKLLSMCYTPALCNIVCICLEYLFLQNAGNVQLPQTMTQFYIQMLQTFIRKHQKQSSPSEEAEWDQYQLALQGLGKLAFRGLEEKKMLFYAAEVPEQVKGFASLCGILLAFGVKTRSGHTQAGYTFVHFGLQEFFSALFLLTSASVDAASLKEKFFLRSKWLLKKEAKMPFTENCHVFLSGLASRECRPFLCSVAGQSEAWVQERQAEVIRLLKKLATPRLTGPRISELCHCVHEAQDCGLAQHVGKQLDFTYRFRNFRLMPLDMMALAFVISSAPDPVSLDFVGCTMDLDYLHVFGNCGNIKNLSFKSRKCGNEFAAALSKNLPSMNCLTTFQLAGGNLTIQGLEPLIQAFLNCSQLEDVNLQDNRMKEQEMIKVAEIFSTMKRLKKLDLSRNEISERTVLTFAEAAGVSPNVTQLHIRKKSLIVYFTGCGKTNSRLNDKEIKEEESVPESRHLILRLQDCQLDSQTAEQLARILQSCPHLSEVDLSDNHLDDEGCSRLMKTVPQMSISGLLNLSNNRLSIKSIFRLLHSMSVCPNIVKLEASIHRQTARLTLIGNELTDTTCSRTSSFARDQLSGEGQQRAATSRTICVADNSFQADNLNCLCMALRSCSGVTELDLSSNSLGDPGVLKILGLVSDLKALHSLILDHNDISLNGAFCLVESFSASECMASMQLGYVHKPTFLLAILSIQSLFKDFSFEKFSKTTELLHLLTIVRFLSLQFGKCPESSYGTLTPEDVDRLFSILIKCPGLTEINLSRSLVNEQSLEQLLVFLPRLDSLKLLR